MSAVAEALRGPRIARVLQFLGVDPKRYWLLMDLFDQLSERGEMLDQARPEWRGPENRCVDLLRLILPDDPAVHCRRRR